MALRWYCLFSLSKFRSKLSVFILHVFALYYTVLHSERFSVQPVSRNRWPFHINTFFGSQPRRSHNICSSSSFPRTGNFSGLPVADMPSTVAVTLGKEPAFLQTPQLINFQLVLSKQEIHTHLFRTMKFPVYDYSVVFSVVSSVLARYDQFLLSLYLTTLENSITEFGIWSD